MRRLFVPRPGATAAPAAGREPALAEDLERGYPSDPAVIDRVRPSVVAAYRSTAASPVRAPAGITRPRLRPAVSLGLAIAVLASGTGVMAAYSGPGDLFYPVRLAVDSLSLPYPWVSSTPLDRMQHRLEEAQGEAGDPAGVSAALDAYRAELELALSGAQTAAERQAVLDALDVHSVVLDELAVDVPDAAEPGLQQAIDRVDAAQESLRVQPSEDPSPAATPVPGRGGKPSESHGPPAR